MMGSVVVLLHGTGQTQVISSSREGNTTQQSHRGLTWREKKSKEESGHYSGLSSVGAEEEVPDKFQRK